MSKMSELHAATEALMERDSAIADHILSGKSAHRWGMLTAGEALLILAQAEAQDCDKASSVLMAHDMLMSMLQDGEE